MKAMRIVVAMALALALGFAAGRGVQMNEKREEVAAQTAASDATIDPIEQFRTERQQLRQRQISQLNDLIHSENAEAEIVAMAQRQLLELTTRQEQECTIENVLRLRSFEDAVATVHADSVNILVRADSLNRQQTAVILELATRETGISGGNVKIIPLN